MVLALAGDSTMTRFVPLALLTRGASPSAVFFRRGDRVTGLLAAAFFLRATGAAGLACCASFFRGATGAPRLVLCCCVDSLQFLFWAKATFHPYYTDSSS